MLQLQAGTEARLGESGYRYERHRLEQMLLYQLLEECYPAFVVQLAAQGTELPEYVQREFEDCLKCGRLEHGFLRVRCDTCHAEHLVAFSCKRRGFCPSCGTRRMAKIVVPVLETDTDTILITSGTYFLRIFIKPFRFSGIVAALSAIN